MANFPTSLDTLLNPSASTLENDSGYEHDVQHSNANDAIEALEAKVGVNSSAVTSSHDYLIAHHAHTGSDGSAEIAGGVTYGQTVDYPTSFTGDVINGSSTTPFADVSAFDTKEVLNSRILHLVTLGASKDQRVRVTLGTTKSAAFDVRVCFAVNSWYWSAQTGDYYTEVRLSTTGDAQLAIARLIPIRLGGNGAAPYAQFVALRVGNSSITSADANMESKFPLGMPITIRITRDGSNNLAFFFGYGTAPMCLARVIDSTQIPYAPTASGTLARIEFAQHSPSGTGSTAQIETFVDYVSSV